MNGRVEFHSYSRWKSRVGFVLNWIVSFTVQTHMLLLGGAEVSRDGEGRVWPSPRRRGHWRLRQLRRWWGWKSKIIGKYLNKVSYWKDIVFLTKMNCTFGKLLYQRWNLCSLFVKSAYASRINFKNLSGTNSNSSSGLRYFKAQYFIIFSYI